MIIAKLENKDVEELTLNFKNALGEVIQYNTTYFEDLERLETITLNGFDVNNDLIEKLNCLEKLKIIIFNHCKFICDDKLKNDIENIIITYSNIAHSNIFEEQEKIKTIELIGIDEVDINNIFCSDDLQIASPIVSDLPELLSPAFGEIMNSMKDILSTVSVDSLLKKYNY